MKEGLDPSYSPLKGVNKMSIESHKGQILPLSNQLIPISKNTIFHASYDHSLYGFNQGQKISPFGYQKSLSCNNTYISVPTLLTSSYTKEAWIYVTGSSSRNIISSASTGHAFYITGNQLSAMHNVGGFQSVTDPANIVTNTWIHVAATYNLSTTTLTLYVNGNQVAQGTSIPGLPEYTIRIGAYNTASFFSGRMSDVRIWNYSRTAQQIKDYMNVELRGDESGLIGYWKLNEGEGIVANDYSTYHNDGIITSGAWGEGRTIATLRPDGKFGGAVAIEEATTNVSLMDGQNGTSPWSGDGGASLSIMDPDVIFRGTKVARFRTGTTGSSNFYLNSASDLSTSTTSTEWTFSCYVKRVDGIPITSVNGYLYVNGNSNVNGPATLESVEDGWYRATYTRTGLVAGYPTLAGLYNLANDTEYYIAQWQVEARSFATSFVSGSRSIGTLWYPDSIFDFTKGTFSCWAKTHVRTNSGDTPTLFWQWDTAGTDQSSIALQLRGNGIIRAQYGVYVSDSSLAWISSPASYNDGNWHHYGMTWENNTNKFYLYVDGQLVASALGAVTLDNVGGRHMRRMPIGRIGWDESYYADPFAVENGDHWNGLIDEIRVEKIAVGADEILSWYQGSAPFYNYLDYTGVG